MEATITRKETLRKQETEEEEEAENETIEIDSPPPSSLLQTQKDLPITAKSLEGRLLCASHVAYEISNPYFRCTSYLPHTTAKRISRSINSVFIGRNIDGIILSFRGTIFTSTLDWMQNAATLLSPGNKRDDIPGSIHVGFYRAVKSLWGGVKEVVLELLQEEAKQQQQSNKKKKTNIYLTGHSKGGAMASIAAYLMYHDLDLPNPTSVVTFGSARVGDDKFKMGYESVVDQITFENDLDLVPFLPPSNTDRGRMDEEMKKKMDNILWPNTTNTKKQKQYIWGYQPIGRRMYIRNNNNNGTAEIVEDTDGKYDAERIRIFEEKTILSYNDFIEAHRSDCEGGYFRAIAPEVCGGFVEGGGSSGEEEDVGVVVVTAVL